MVRKNVFTVALATIIALGAGVALAADTARVTGTVVDAFTGIPVSGFTVLGRDGTGSEIKATTDSKGHYTMLGVGYGKITLSGAGNGYFSAQVSCKVPSGESVRFDFKVSHDAPTTHMHSSCRVEPNTADRYIIE